MVVIILDGQPPTVTRCPNSFQVFLDIGQVGVYVQLYMRP